MWGPYAQQAWDNLYGRSVSVLQVWPGEGSGIHWEVIGWGFYRAAVATLHAEREFVTLTDKVLP